MQYQLTITMPWKFQFFEQGGKEMSRYAYVREIVDLVHDEGVSLRYEKEELFQHLTRTT